MSQFKKYLEIIQESPQSNQEMFALLKKSELKSLGNNWDTKLRNFLTLIDKEITSSTSAGDKSEINNFAGGFFWFFYNFRKPEGQSTRRNN